MRAASTYDAEFVGFGGGPGGPSTRSAARVFVLALLGVITMLFFLLSIAYLSRAQVGDWRSLAASPADPFGTPWRLWLNSALLAASSAALHWARRAERRGRPGAARRGVATAGALALAFVAGQLAVWQDLVARGYVVADNPANSFFYLITALHGVHLLVGLLALGIVAAKAWRRPPFGADSAGLALCSLYWDFLFVLWLAMFALIASPPESLDAFAALCGLR